MTEHPLGSLDVGPCAHRDGLTEGEFIAYPSTFTRTPDSYGDVVAPGAFAETSGEWKASGNVVPGLFGHRMDDREYFVASATDMSEDDHGWWVRGRFDLDTPKGAQVYRLVKDKRLAQLSFAFDVLDHAKVTLEDGTTANELLQNARVRVQLRPGRSEPGRLRRRRQALTSA